MANTGWYIPNDFVDDAWQCIQIQWPNTPQYTRLLIGLLYTLTRGREYDASTGAVTDAQRVGWAIFDRNVPLTVCTMHGGDTDVTAVQSLSGGSIFIQEEDMGQVVTDCYIDNETGELVVEFGKCCVWRYSLRDGTLTEVANDTGVFTPEPPGDDEAYAPEYFRCGKADAVLTRIEAIGQAAWSSRVEPWEVKGAIEDANPGYTVASIKVASLLVCLAGLSAIEGVTDADIFNAEFLTAWKCWVLSRSENDSDGLSKTEWAEMLLWLNAYPFTSENVDAGVVIDYYAMQYWVIIADEILGRERFNQIMAEGMFTEADCSECYGASLDDRPTSPDANGWYLTAPVGDMTMVNDDYWQPYMYRGVPNANVYGAVVEVYYYSASTIKSMSCNNTEGDGNLAPQPEQCISPDTSGQLQAGHEGGTSWYIVFINDDTIAASVMGALGVDSDDWTRQNPIADVSAAAPSTIALANMLVGLRVDARDICTGLTFTNVRWLHNTGL